MGNIIPTSVNFNLPNGKKVTIETGKLATMAHGSAVVRVDNTMLLATVVAASKPKEGQDFFPLSVDYQEKFAGAGKIPGNFFRRESKLSDYEVLISRLVDRAIRPLFDDDFVNDTNHDIFNFRRSQQYARLLCSVGSIRGPCSFRHSFQRAYF